MANNPHLKVWLSQDEYRDPDDNLAMLVGEAQAPTVDKSSSALTIAGFVYGDTRDGGPYYMLNPTGHAPKSFGSDPRFGDQAAGNYEFYYGKAGLQDLSAGEWAQYDLLAPDKGGQRAWNFDATSKAQLSSAAPALAVTSAVIDFGAPAIHADVDAEPGPAGSLQTLANYLSSGYWQDTGRSSRYFDVAANGGTIHYNLSGHGSDSNGLTAARQTMAREAFKIYEEVLGIDFVETTSSGTEVDIFLKDNASGAGHSGTMYSGSGGKIDYATVNVAKNWEDGTSNIGGEEGRTFQTFLHEIGHALGLGHQGTYNGDGDTDIPFWSNDNWQQSMMSYLDQGESVGAAASFAYLLSPMHVDFLALDNIYAFQGYGVSNAFGGDTVWGFNTTIAADVSAAYAAIADLGDTTAFCIVDGGGIDTVDFSGYSATQTINLAVASSGSTTGSISNIGGLIGNMTLAVGTVIENAIGGSGNDTITGNSAANRIICGAGNDSVFGSSGNDTLLGEEGNDTLRGEAGNDTLRGGDVKDQLIGGSGRDVFDFNFATDSAPGAANWDELRAGGGGNAFDAAGSAAGDMFDFRDIGDLKWGGTDMGSIYLENVNSVTHCYVNIDSDAPAELDIAIYDGAVLAGAYTAADFDFV